VKICSLDNQKRRCLPAAYAWYLKIGKTIASFNKSFNTFSTKEYSFPEPGIHQSNSTALTLFTSKARLSERPPLVKITEDFPPSPLGLVQHTAHRQHPGMAGRENLQTHFSETQ